MKCVTDPETERPIDFATVPGPAQRREHQWKLDRVLQEFEVQNGMAINVATGCVDS